MLTLANTQAAAAAAQWLLSIDIPLMLLLSGLVCSSILARSARRGEHRWLAPAIDSRAARWLLVTLGILGSLRWPLALALASVLLVAGEESSRHLQELLLMSLGGSLLGAALAAMLHRSREAAEGDGGVPARGRGLAALSWAPLQEAWRQMHLRRLALLSMPLLLAAPMGTPAGEVAAALAAWIPMLFLITSAREAARTVEVAGRWLPLNVLGSLHLRWWAWRYVAGTGAVCVFAAWAGWKVLQR